MFSEPEVRHHLEYYLELFHKNSCIRWIKRTYEDDYLVIKASLDEQGELVDRCYSSSVGMKGGVQYVHLTTRCLGLMPGYIPALYNIPHELMHALGFIHEQSRLDRDCYIALTRFTLSVPLPLSSDCSRRRSVAVNRLAAKGRQGKVTCYKDALLRDQVAPGCFDSLAAIWISSVLTEASGGTKRCSLELVPSWF
ncbi:hypothetical protein J6590_074076 [Homalodisca vitripennis]|nr:hypothetical protein J6590_074076 [Homalodisca vitripennis]